MLYTRYANWASLSVAAPQAGYRLFEPLRGEVRTIFGRPVPVGPLDNGGTLQLVDPHGRPIGSVVVLVEVKNVHHWMYTSATELYELLDKAAQLQMAIPDTGFVPVLVCRRGHPTIFIAPYASKRLVKMFAEDLPAIAKRSAERFKQAAPILATMTPLLKAARPYQQRTLMARLRHMTRELRQAGGW